jgi:hypothetical protein
MYITASAFVLNALTTVFILKFRDKAQSSNFPYKVRKQ